MNTIELFSGTKSFSKVASELGHNTLTIDNDAKLTPDVCADLLTWEPQLPYGEVDIIWASPPCQCFSVAAIGKNWNKDYSAKRPEAEIAVNLVAKTIQIIRQIKPTYWFIENPRGMLRKLPVMQGLHRKTITYCQYGDTRMKPTDIWTNFVEWEPKAACKNGDKCHESAPRGTRQGTQGIKGARDRGVIPPEVFREIFKAISIKKGGY